MKTSHICPKCQFHRILHVKEIAARVGDLSGEAVANEPAKATTTDATSCAWRLARQTRQVKLLGGLVEAHQDTVSGLVEAYICKRCGLTEFYTQDPELIHVDGDRVCELVGPEAAAFR